MWDRSQEHVSGHAFRRQPDCLQLRRRENAPRPGGNQPGARPVGESGRFLGGIAAAPGRFSYGHLRGFDGTFLIDAVAKRFYRSHDDEFDFLTAIGASDIPYDVVGGGAFAFFAPIQNEIRGIGINQGEFNGGPAAFGSDGRLEGFVSMNKLSEFPASPTQTFLGTNSTLDIMAQEIGHRWLAFVEFNDANVPNSALLGRDSAHWNFFMDSDASEMEGNDWRDNGNGTFTSIDATSRYSALDRYLMGLGSPFEVPSFFFVKNLTNAAGKTTTSAPEIGITVAGTRQDVTVAQVIQQEGVRDPAFPAAPSEFRQAFILVIPEGSRASAGDLAKLETIRQNWEIFFSIVTAGRGRIDSGLRANQGPDLVPLNAGVSPATASPGSVVTVNFTIVNQGMSAAGPAIHEVRSQPIPLSTGPTCCWEQWPPVISRRETRRASSPPW